MEKLWGQILKIKWKICAVSTKNYDILEVENLNTLQHGFGKQKGRFYEFYNTGYDADSRNKI